MESERISNLPQDVIDSILTRLPLRDAVRTSILSRNWKHKWVHLKHLVFDNEIMAVSCEDPKPPLIKLIKIVDNVLLLHSGPIHKLKLSHDKLKGCDDIVKWISFLSSKSVKEFVLDVWDGDAYKLPPSLYSWQDLIKLELYNCLVKPPSAFSGFQGLKVLDLQRVVMDQAGFENLISGCPLLEELIFRNFHGFSHVNIYAPNLLSIEIGGAFEDLDFGKSFHLSDVSISFVGHAGNNQDQIFQDTGSLIKFFASIRHIQSLEVQDFFLKFLAVKMVPNRQPAMCMIMKLTNLSLDINFWDVDECLAVLCLLRSSPNLQELKMQARQEQQADDRELTSNSEVDYKNCLLKQLRHVKMIGMPRFPIVLDMCNFLLANSPVLETMTVKPACLVLFRDLLRFRRASPLAEIIYLDP